MPEMPYQAPGGHATAINQQDLRRNCPRCRMLSWQSGQVIFAIGLHDSPVDVRALHPLLEQAAANLRAARVTLYLALPTHDHRTGGRSGRRPARA